MHRAQLAELESEPELLTEDALAAAALADAGQLFPPGAGVAVAAGVKVVLVVNNFDDAPGGAIQSVMTSAAIRSL